MSLPSGLFTVSVSIPATRIGLVADRKSSSLSRKRESVAPSALRAGRFASVRNSPIRAGLFDFFKKPLSQVKEKKRAELKQELLEVISPLSRGVEATSEAQEEVESVSRLLYHFLARFIDSFQYFASDSRKTRSIEPNKGASQVAFD